MPVIQAILKGLRKRHETTGDVPILIHTVRISSRPTIMTVAVC